MSGGRRSKAPRNLGLRFYPDTNCINSRQRLHFMNKLEAWAHEGILELLLAEPAFDEATRDGDPLRVAKASASIRTLTYPETPDELAMLRRLEEIIFPGGAKTDSERTDVEIVFNAQKYGGFLVTTDGASKRQPRGILGSKADLERLAIRVMTPEEACALVEARIAVLRR